MLTFTFQCGNIEQHCFMFLLFNFPRLCDTFCVAQVETNEVIEVGIRAAEFFRWRKTFFF